MRLDEKKRESFICDLRITYELVYKEAGKYASYTKKIILLDRAVKKPAQSFYVSREEASRMIHFIKKNGLTGKRNKELSEKYNDIYREFLRLSEMFPDLSFMSIVDIIVEESKAPQFYIKAQTAALLLNKYIGL